MLSKLTTRIDGRNVGAVELALRVQLETIVAQNVAPSMQRSVLCHTRKVLHAVAEFYTLRLLGGGRFFQRDSPSPPPRRLHRAFLSKDE
jgi:hypothetical protein